MRARSLDRKLSDVIQPASLRILWRVAFGILVICSAIQISIDTTVANFTCVVISLAVPLLVTKIVDPGKNIKKHLFPTISVLLYMLSNLTLPLAIKTLDVEPLTYNLALPMQTFALTAVTALTLAFSLRLYASLKGAARARSFLSKRFFAPLCAFRVPTEGQLWLMGLIGIAATLFVIVSGGFNDISHKERGNVEVAHLAYWFSSFTYAPFLLLARHLIAGQQENSRRNWLLFLQFTAVVALGLGMNGRAAIVLPVVNMGVWFLLGAVSGVKPLTKLALRNILVITGLCIVVSPLLADFATGMVLARATRDKASAIQLVTSSLDNMANKGEVEHKRAELETHKGNNTYAHNEFLSRFVDIKFLDLMLDWSSTITPLEKRDFIDLATVKIWNIIPSPIAVALGSGSDKYAAASQKTFADFFYNERYAKENLVGKRTGNFIAVGLILHGFAFFPFLVLVALCLFTAFDAMIVYVVRTDESGVQSRVLSISPLLLINAYLVAATFSATNGHDSEIFFIQWLIRDLPQSVVLYFLVFQLTRIVSSIGSAGAKRTKRLPMLRRVHEG